MSKSKSAPITITSEELRFFAEKRLGRRVDDDIWSQCEQYARMKLESCREREPKIAYYNDFYLILLTVDTVREKENSLLLEADCLAKQIKGWGPDVHVKV